MLAAGKEAMPWTERPGWIALHFREPGLRLFGDLRTAVANGAMAVGCYCLLLGCVYLSQTLGRERYGGEYIVDVTSLMACFIALMNAFLYYACIKQKNDTHLEHLLCATMTLYKIDVPFSVIAHFVSAVISIDLLPFWMIIRIALCILHMCLVYCLLVEVRENNDPSASPELQSNADLRGVKSSEKFPKEEDAESGVLTTP
ncbi:hypothetical protein R5R35_005565 [Gryllus longicercus]|uniref:Transmembrane protein n=1 Tax=Gryllus longicercus TaxID=2509291 RepID=A0AAN9ZAM8_9ORTH